MNQSEKAILVIMSIMGIGGLLAIPAIFLPYSWMNACHDYMGLGTLPNTPIVSYLARSLSAFYAVAGAVTLGIAWDVRANRSLVKIWATFIAIMGAVLLGIDLYSGMPTRWILMEGPPALAIGLLVLMLHKSVSQSPVS